MLYCQALLPPAGLGNKLLPWARCRIFAEVNQAPMLKPQWAQFKIGPLLRGETDLRLYHNLFVHRKGDISGLRKLRLGRRSVKIAEPEHFSQPFQAPQAVKETIVLFEEKKDLFYRLNGWNSLLYTDIVAMTRKRWLDRVNSLEPLTVGVHVRRGDFREATAQGDFFTQGALRSPLAWYIKSLRVICAVAKQRPRVFVVSDGTPVELHELLAEPGVTLVRTGSAIGDMLALSRAKVLLASGGSSFSAWATFLGQMPTISHPGQSMTWFGVENQRGYYIGEFDPQHPPPEFLYQVKSVLR